MTTDDITSRDSLRDGLIDRLSNTPLTRAPLMPAQRRGSLWLALSLTFVVIACGLLAPYRNGFFGQLLESPRYFTETLLGIIAVLSTGFFAFQSMIPGGARSKLNLTIGLAAAAGFVLLLVYGLFDPAITPSMDGKRATCVYEAFFYGLLPGIAAVWLGRRAYALQPVTTSIAIGLSASLPGAIIMQVGCMYDPSHDLKFHVIPALLMGALLTLAGVVWLRIKK